MFLYAGGRILAFEWRILDFVGSIQGIVVHILDFDQPIQGFSHYILKFTFFTQFGVLEMVPVGVPTGTFTVGLHFKYVLFAGAYSSIRWSLSPFGYLDSRIRCTHSRFRPTCSRIQPLHSKIHDSHTI